MTSRETVRVTWIATIGLPRTVRYMQQYHQVRCAGWLLWLHGCKISIFVVPKPGKCPKYEIPLPRQPCDPLPGICNDDSDCPDEEKCCRREFCGQKICGPPADGTCDAVVDSGVARLHTKP